MGNKKEDTLVSETNTFKEEMYIPEDVKQFLKQSKLGDMINKSYEEFQLFIENEKLITNTIESIEDPYEFNDNDLAYILKVSSKSATTVWGLFQDIYEIARNNYEEIDNNNIGEKNPGFINFLDTYYNFITAVNKVSRYYNDTNMNDKKDPRQIMAMLCNNEFDFLTQKDNPECNNKRDILNKCNKNISDYEEILTKYSNVLEKFKEIVELHEKPKLEGLMEIEKVQPNEKAKELIAEYSTNFLRTRMKLTQEILNSNDTNTITLTTYNNGLDEINKNDRRTLSKYEENNISRILVTDEEIEELVNLVHVSLSTYSISDSAYSYPFSSLISDALRNLTQSNDYDLLMTINKWINISYGEHGFAIDPRIQGRVDWRYFDEFVITDSNNNLVAKIGLDGTDKLITENTKQEEDVLIANNIIFGKLVVNNDKTNDPQTFFTFFLKKVIDDEIKYKALFYCDELITDNKDDNAYVIPLDNFNTVLSSRNLDYLIEDYYDREAFEKAAITLSRINNITNEEKEKIEEVISVAVNWWAEACLFASYANDFALHSENGTVSATYIPLLSHAKLELFKHYLGNEIRSVLMAGQNNISLNVNYEPDHYLSTASNKANSLEGTVSFPIKTRMTISKDEVAVWDGHSAVKKVLYSSSIVNDNTNTKDGSSLKR